MKLNDKQKMFLVEHSYVTQKVLDDWQGWGWWNFYVNNFEWKLGMKKVYGFRKLELYNKESDILHEIELNFQGNDLKELMEMGDK